MSTAAPPVAHQVAVKALRWLRTNQRLGAMPPNTTADIAEPNNTYKPLSENALAASLVLREGVAEPADLHAAEDILDFAWRELRAGDLLYERALLHTLMTDPLEVYAHFVRCGRRHPNLDQLLAHQTRLRSVRAIEVLSNRKLAIANAARIVGLDYGHDWDILTATTWLGAIPEPWTIDWMTAYHMTHTVFHLTDWGAHPNGLNAEITSYLQTWLPVWIEVWLEIGQWDLVGELLIVGACLDEPYRDPEHWAAFAAVQHDDGLVPRDTEPVDGTPEQVFTEQQHTAVVAIVAGTLATARTSNSPSRT